jgi:hypothetical protein
LGLGVHGVCNKKALETRMAVEGKQSRCLLVLACAMQRLPAKRRPSVDAGLPRKSSRFGDDV